MHAQIIHGDCLAVLSTLPDNSIDAICCDPPYHLTIARRKNGTGFMGKEWDGGDIAFRPDVWRECLRVLKPGGHLIAFGGARTHHRLWVAIEDAGFQIRDTLMWVFASGFPKSLNIAKSIQALKQTGNPRFDNRDFPHTDIDLPGQQFVETNTGTWSGKSGTVTDPEALQWQGWHTGLKPSHEPICLARKPLDGTVVHNVLAHGTGGINVDGSRVGTTTETHGSKSRAERHGFVKGFVDGTESVQHDHGRWPPNLSHDGSDEVLECLPQSDHFYPQLGFSDDERRLMYHSKANKRDRAGSSHPTVKPIKLMEWLCKLITPPGGVILDPFAGSGTTGAAALNLGFDCILIERELEYIQDIQKRIASLQLIEFVSQ